MNALVKIGALLRVVVPCFCFERRRALAKDRPRPQLRLGCFCRGQHLAYVANGGSLFRPLDAVAVFANRFMMDFASYRAAGTNVTNEPERNGPAELSETRRVHGTQ